MFSWMITQTTTTTKTTNEALVSDNYYAASNRLSRLVIVFIFAINFFTQLATVSSSGVFQLQFTSFQNDKGYTDSNTCCSGNSSSRPETEVCRAPCRTFFTVCLRHFQHNIPQNQDLQCTYGQKTTAVLGHNTFDASKNDSKYLVDLPFDFTWPGSFSLIVKAWHDLSATGPHPGRNRTLIMHLAISRQLDVIEGWRPDHYVKRHSRLDYRYRVVCNENYYGAGCSEMCTPRDDFFGHYTCSPNATRVCRPGWTGEYCQTAVCLEGCNTTNGHCDEPFECKCRLGWQGKLCNACIPYPGCLNGGCNDRWQCNCFEGWGGLFCNQDLNFCTNNRPCRNGATCRNSGEGSYNCDCPSGFTGTNCEIEIFECHHNRCKNGGKCQHSNGQYRCDCLDGFSGRRCETSARSCRDRPCINNGTCENDGGGGMGYRCQCLPGFTGSNCEVDIGECDSVPCLNGGRCIDEQRRYRCVCSAGFTGERCEQNLNDCLNSPCLNNGTCVDQVNRFQCRCLPGFTGDLCQDNVDDCMTHPCANGATCHDRDNGFQCRCAPGFAGRDCSVKIDECQSRPCVRGTCHDLMNGYRCQCDAGFTGTNCELPLGPHHPTPTDVVPVVVVTSGLGGNATDSSTPSSGHVPQAPGDHDVTQTVVVICLGVLLTLFALCMAVVVIVLRHRHRHRLRSRDNFLEEKMNNAETRNEEQLKAADKAKNSGQMELLRQNQKQQQFTDFASKEQSHMQRNINHTNNLKNVDKCPARKQNPFAGSAAKPGDALEKRADNSEAKTNKGASMSSRTWKQSDGSLPRTASQNASVCTYIHQEPSIFTEGMIATEV